MTAWSGEDIASMGRADELQISSRRPDESLRGFVTIWWVRVGNEVYVRSAHGPDNPWFKRALRSGQGRIRAGGVERDVLFEVPGGDMAAAITAAYHAKYDRYGPAIVGAVVSATAVGSTLRVAPR